MRPPAAGPAGKAAFWLVLLALLARTLLFHADLIRFPYPLDGHEPAQEELARGVAQGLSSGDASTFPMMVSVYGPVYSLLTGGLCRLGLACDLQGQRALCALLLAALLVLLAAVCLRSGAGVLGTAALLAWGYELLLINVTPIARPDALGLLLWFAGLAAPFLLGESLPVLALTAALFALAAATKLYFLCGPLYLAAGLALAGRWRALGRFAVLQSAALLAAGLWLAHSFPLDLYVGALNQTTNLTFDTAYLLWQCRRVLLDASPFALPLLACTAWWRWRARGTGAGSAGSGGAWGVYAGVGMALFVLFLGGALGARFTYLIQLVLLPCLAWFAGALPSSGRWRPVVLTLLLGNALCTAQALALHPGLEPDGTVAREWRRAGALVELARRPMVCADLDFTLRARGLKVYDTGLNNCDFLLRPRDPRLVRALLPRLPELIDRYQAWLNAAWGDALDPRTDLLAVHDGSPLAFGGAVRDRFVPIGTLHVDYPQTQGFETITCYVPRAGPSQALAQALQQH